MPITLPERFDITAARAVHGELVDALASGAPVEIDASAVARTDTAGLQLVLAALHAGEPTPEDTPRVRLTARSDAFDRAAAALGADALLASPATPRQRNEGNQEQTPS